MSSVRRYPPVAALLGLWLAGCGLALGDLPQADPAAEAGVDSGRSQDGGEPTPDAGGPDVGAPPVARCGDGELQAGEACDDGNQLQDDACLNDCSAARCGDGIRRTDLQDPGQDGYEQCDDGNEETGDACPAACREAVCGDGFLRDGVEACDDGNPVDDDDCSNRCTQARCGDGIVQAGEACDDGNRDELDACLNDCVAARCGDGLQRVDLEAGANGYEACDDGNESQTDACLNDCQAARCGDGQLREGLEECDDGNGEDLDACSNDCRRAACGDGRVQGDEVCDDGNQADDDACRANCVAAACGDGIRRVDRLEGQEDFEACDDGNDLQTDACLNDCSAARCGDGHLGPGEGCDDGDNIDDNACSNSCVALSCGDGDLQAGEACDDGNDVNQDACTNSCANASCGDGFVRNDLPPEDQDFEGCDDGNGIDQDACTNGCTVARCGDAVLHAGNEECDDGNQVDDDACSNRCENARCGDQIIQAGEACDDGNNEDRDACRNSCQSARCGDGVLRLDLGQVLGQEACDDGNEIDGDACTNACTEAVCGDGVVRLGLEECDDGNRVDGDDCSNACGLPACGDGIIQAGEVCDDGNAENGDACGADCSAAARCGDGERRMDLEPGQAGFEACDDGNQSQSDACLNDCSLAQCGDGHRRDDLDLGQAGFEACDDGDEDDEDGCLNDCSLARCGDGIRRQDLEDWQAGYEACDDGNEVDHDNCPNDCQPDEPDPGDEPSFECPEASLFNLQHPWYLDAEGTVLWVRPGANGNGDSQEQASGDLAAMLSRLVEGAGGTLMLAEGDHLLSASSGNADITIIGACADETRVNGEGGTVLSASGGSLRLSGLDLFSAIEPLDGGSNTIPVIQADGGHLIVDHAEISDGGAGLGIRIVGARLTLQDSELGAFGATALGAQSGLGSWVVEDNTFLGPIGHDGISIIDFGGSDFSFSGNEISDVGGHGLYADAALGSWVVEDNTFLGPIGHDGISIIDFGGTGFRVAGNSLEDIDGYGLLGRDSLGTWTVEDNTFLGPIGHDGIMLNRVGGAGSVESNSFEEMSGNGLSALHLGAQQEALGTWTVEDNTFLGPIGHDGISVTGFGGQAMTLSDNSITGVAERGIMVTGSSATVTMEDNDITDSDGEGVVASGFSAGSDLNFNRNDIDGAQGLAARFNNMGGAISASSNTFRNTRADEQGGNHEAISSGLGLQATEVRSLNLQSNAFNGNSGGAVVVDLQAWHEVDELLEAENEAVSVVLQDNTVQNPGENLPTYALQHLPEDAQVGGNNDQDADPDHHLERVYAARQGCGDGFPEAPEECDDGNLDPGDGCTARCTQEAAGNAHLALGERFSCRVDPAAQDRVRCWGDNTASQLKIPPSNANASAQSISISYQGAWTILQLAAGAFHACALAENAQNLRQVFCWGDNTHGQAGVAPNVRDIDCGTRADWPGGGGDDPPCENPRDPNCGGGGGGGGGGGDPPASIRCSTNLVEGDTIPIKLDDESTLEAVYQVTAGDAHSCALVRLSGRREVVCWGAYGKHQQGIWPNAFGEFDPNDPGGAPGMLGGQNPAVAAGHRVYMQGVEPHVLVSGGDFNCVLDVVGRAYCWGDNSEGQLGRGHDVVLGSNGEVLPVEGDNRYLQLAAGQKHVCGLTTRGAMDCWGDDNRGQMGKGRSSDTNITRPTAREEMNQQLVFWPVKSMAAGHGHTILIQAMGDQTQGWGDNRWKQLGNLSDGDYPQTIPSAPLMGDEQNPRLLHPGIRVSAGGRHSCALDRLGIVACWGHNGLNQVTVTPAEATVIEPMRVQFP